MTQAVNPSAEPALRIGVIRNARGSLSFAPKTHQRVLGIRVVRQNAFERHDPARMPLSRAVNDAHPAASYFFQNLIIPKKPIPILTMYVAEQIIQGRLRLGMLSVTVAINARGKKTLQTKAAPHARSGPAFCTEARFNFELKRYGTAGRTHRGATSINRGSVVANANSQITGKLFTTDFLPQAENKVANPRLQMAQLNFAAATIPQRLTLRRDSATRHRSRFLRPLFRQPLP